MACQALEAREYLATATCQSRLSAWCATHRELARPTRDWAGSAWGGPSGGRGSLSCGRLREDSRRGERMREGQGSLGGICGGGAGVAGNCDRRPGTGVMERPGRSLGVGAARSNPSSSPGSAGCSDR